MSRLTKKVSFAAVLAIAITLALPGAATAIPLTLTGPIAGNTVGPQSTSNPCIIAGTQCQQPAGSGSITSFKVETKPRSTCIAPRPRRPLPTASRARPILLRRLMRLW